MGSVSPKHILIAAADPYERMRLSALLSGAGFSASVCGDGRDIPSALRQTRTDVLLLHLVLPGMDGIAVLESLPRQRLETYPAVVMLHHVGMERFAERARRLGGKSFLPATSDGAVIVGACKRVGPEDRMYAVGLYLREIVRMIAELGFPANLSGPQYLQTGIAYALSDYRLLRDMAHVLYPLIARRYGTDSPAVERGIRHAIEAAWRSGAYERQYELFGNTIDEKRGKPTNGGMLARATEYLRTKEMSA